MGNDDGQRQPIVPRSPVPMNVDIRVVSSPAGPRFLMLTFNTPSHEASYFIPDEAAAQFARDVHTKAEEATGRGIIMPYREGPRGE